MIIIYFLSSELKLIETIMHLLSVQRNVTLTGEILFALTVVASYRQFVKQLWVTDSYVLLSHLII